MESNQGLTLADLFSTVINVIARSRNAVRGDPGQVRLPPPTENRERKDDETQ